MKKVYEPSEKQNLKKEHYNNILYANFIIDAAFLWSIWEAKSIKKNYKILYTNFITRCCCVMNSIMQT